jgi:ribosomal protein L37AE/L43A
MCDLSGNAAIYRYASGIRLCSECQGDLMGMPIFTQQQIGRFLIGNVL